MNDFSSSIDLDGSQGRFIGLNGGLYKGPKGQHEKINLFKFFLKSFLGVARPPPGVPGPKNLCETLEKQAQTGRIQKGAPGPPSPPPPYGRTLKKTIKKGHKAVGRAGGESI